MTKHSLEHFTPSLNPYVTPYDTLHQCLNQALAHVALLDNFSSSEKSIIYGYMSALEDLIIKAKSALDELWQHIDQKSMVQNVRVYWANALSAFSYNTDGVCSQAFVL